MMTTQRPLTGAEKAQLTALTHAVRVAKRELEKWLDAKMIETSILQVGDDIYDLGLGIKVGVVTELYRYHDTSVHCDYRYETNIRLCFDNTSRQPERSFGTREDAIRAAKIRLESIQ